MLQEIKNRFTPEITFICHYFPPDESVGIRRVLFWVEYLSEKGFKVLVITTKKNDSFTSLKKLNDNVRVLEYSTFGFSSLDFNMHESLVGNRVKTDYKIIGLFKKIKRKLLNPIVGQLSDPRIINVAISLVYLRFNFRISALSEYDFSRTTFISTAPPWPMHLLGLSLSKKYKRKVFLDYRDPFSNNHMFSSKLSYIENKIDSYLCRKASGIFSVSESWVEYYKTFSNDVYLLRNGFDKSLSISGVPEVRLYDKDVLRVGYFGSVEHKERFPQLIFDYIERGNRNIVVEFYGVYSFVEEYLKDKPELKGQVKLFGKKPYKECLEIMKNTDINLLCETFNGNSLSHRGVIPTKLYEYISAKRPVLAMISGDSDMVPLLTNSGILLSRVSSYSDLEVALSLNYLKSVEIIPNVDFIDSLSRQKVAEELIRNIDNV